MNKRTFTLHNLFALALLCAGAITSGTIFGAEEQKEVKQEVKEDHAPEDTGNINMALPYTVALPQQSGVLPYAKNEDRRTVMLKHKGKHYVAFLHKTKKDAAEEYNQKITNADLDTWSAQKWTLGCGLGSLAGQVAAWGARKLIQRSMMRAFMESNSRYIQALQYAETAGSILSTIGLLGSIYNFNNIFKRDEVAAKLARAQAITNDIDSGEKRNESPYITIAHEINKVNKEKNILAWGDSESKEEEKAPAVVARPDELWLVDSLIELNGEREKYPKAAFVDDNNVFVYDSAKQAKNRTDAVQNESNKRSTCVLMNLSQDEYYRIMERLALKAENDPKYLLDKWRLGEALAEFKPQENRLSRQLDFSTKSSEIAFLKMIGLSINFKHFYPRGNYANYPTTWTRSRLYNKLPDMTRLKEWGATVKNAAAPVAATLGKVFSRGEKHKAYSAV